MINIVKKSNILVVLFILYFFIVFYWLIANFILDSNALRQSYSDMYGVLALISGLYGLFTAKKWGGLNSLLGKSVTFLSLGLSAQGFGQVVYTLYYVLFHIEAPYPSLGDVGYFGSIILYALGVYYIGKAAGVRYSKNNLKSVFFSILVPLLILGFVYNFFLSGYDFSEVSVLVAFLDFAYPIGQAIFLNFAILTYLLSFDRLGGLFRNRVMLIIVAIILQYAADFMFLYQFYHDEWIAGGFNDLMYLVAYFFMTLGLVYLEGVFQQVKND